VPSVREIQEVLARVDPEKARMRNFVGSNAWIGSYEVMMVLQHVVPDLECKIVRVDRGAEFSTNPSIVRQLVTHFERSACPVMIGGAAYAHTILGVDADMRTGECSLLILDPHYVAGGGRGAQQPSLDVIVAKGWCGWKRPADFFKQDEWYNLCMPVVTSLPL